MLPDQLTLEDIPEITDCCWCGNPVRGRFVTYRFPDGRVLYSHGKCRWFPELWRKINPENLDWVTSHGEFGEIIAFKEALP